MMKRMRTAAVTTILAMLVAACGSTGAGNAPTGGASTPSPAQAPVASSEGSKSTDQGNDKLVMVWLPNESSDTVKGAREAIGSVISGALDKEIEHVTTTDYIIAIESIVNGKADVAFLGAQAYIEANQKNPNVQPMVVNSGASGTLDDAVYYSWLAVNKGEEDNYRSGDGFAIDNIAGKRFSFVSNSSTSGFKVPSAGIVSYFSKQDKYKDLTVEDLLEGGDKEFFSKVLFGGSHQGSAVNLLSGKADVAAVCDYCIKKYIELADGPENTPGSTYRVLQDAEEPFNTVKGAEFAIISVTPVLNSPIVVNKDKVSEEEIAKIVKALTSDAAADNKQIFVPKDSEIKGIFSKTDKERFVPVTDDWFNPVRELSK
ncbi:PhnD/SsuA/transferrin family substrate-binding protein [Paenibacillus sp. SYP-B4298]|uniref:PhnD/SsuA/transferrin family substrate-binding protein n=1 Tax=Paenibacillus sp. SYP-B4298 TaxID=2996034 RepID=UPI0022DDE684|nr:PhnD/SsuA/transferrin family substrate-binding protein [Paenibacillus sp. SYP-B4298]